MARIENFTYDELIIGQTATFDRQVEERDIQLFAAVSGDVNPVHLDAEFAASTPFGERIAHGMLTGAFISAALAMVMPGPGTVYVSQSLRFRLPVKIGDRITISLEITDKQDRRRLVTVDCKAHNAAGKLVATGTAEVIAPEVKRVIDAPAVPVVEI